MFPASSHSAAMSHLLSRRHCMLKGHSLCPMLRWLWIKKQNLAKITGHHSPLSPHWVIQTLWNVTLGLFWAKWLYNTSLELESLSLVLEPKDYCHIVLITIVQEMFHVFQIKWRDGLGNLGNLFIYLDLLLQIVPHISCFRVSGCLLSTFQPAYVMLLMWLQLTVAVRDFCLSLCPLCKCSSRLFTQTWLSKES